MEWSNNITGERHSVTATSVTGSTYTSSLIISPLAVQDNSTYTCTGIVTGEYEQQVTASDSHTLPTIFTAPKLNTFSVDSTTATSITLRWSVSSDSLVDRYVVTWKESNSAASVTVTITDPSATTYTLMGLESQATYSITVTASNAAGSTTSTPILVTTTEVTSGYEGDNTAAVIAAIVLGTLLILSVTVIIIVTVTWLWKNYDTCKNKPAGSTMDIPASANVAYELSKFSSQLKEAIYKEPGRVITSIEVKGVNRSTKHTESEVTSTLNSDYESVAMDGVKSPSTTHAIQAAAAESTLYEEIH